MDFSSYYFFFKAIHIISVICFMCGMLYLPRLFVYHVEKKENLEIRKVFEVMESKLVKIIIIPAMVFVILSGLSVIHLFLKEANSGWLYTKIGLFFVMCIFLFYFELIRRKFFIGMFFLSSKRIRILNEIPAILMIIIVLLVVFKPF